MFLRPDENPGMLLNLNYRDFAPSMPARERLVITMKVRNRCLQKFRALWYVEYLINLSERP